MGTASVSLVQTFTMRFNRLRIPTSVSLVQKFTTRFNRLRIPTSVSLVQKFTTIFNRLRIPTSVSLVQKFTTIFNRLRIPKSILHLRVHIAGYISVRKPLRMLNVCIGMVQSCCTHVPNGGILQSDIGVRLLEGEQLQRVQNVGRACEFYGCYGDKLAHETTRRRDCVYETLPRTGDRRKLICCNCFIPF